MLAESGDRLEEDVFAGGPEEMDLQPNLIHDREILLQQAAITILPVVNTHMQTHTHTPNNTAQNNLPISSLFISPLTDVFNSRCCPNEVTLACSYWQDQSAALVLETLRSYKLKMLSSKSSLSSVFCAAHPPKIHQFCILTIYQQFNLFFFTFENIWNSVNHNGWWGGENQLKTLRQGANHFNNVNVAPSAVMHEKTAFNIRSAVKLYLIQGLTSQSTENNYLHRTDNKIKS